MLFITIIILIVAKALPVLNTQITSSQFSRLTSISLIFAGLISLNGLNLEILGSGIGIYSGLFHITQVSQIFEIFIFFIGGFILMGWYQPRLLTFSPGLSGDLPVAGAGIAFHGNLCSQPFPAALTSAPSLKEARVPDFFLWKKSGQEKKKGETEKNNNMTDYSLIILFSILGSSLLITSFDLISIYLSIELQSFGLYVLSTLYKNSESSTSSGLKYFLLGGLSSCIILLGIGLIYSYTGITNLESLYILNTVSTPAGGLDSALQGLSIGLILIFVGFLFKIAAAPLHNWSPDVYDGTPTIVTSWLTIVPKISILILLLELQIQLGSADPIIGGIKTLLLNNTGYLLDGLNTGIKLGSSNTVLPVFALEVTGQEVIKTLLLISSVLSLIVGSLLGLAQIRIKRLLAYSTISHIGFLLLALAINTEQSIDSFLFYLIQYTLTNLNIFLIILAFTYLMNNNYLLLKNNGDNTNAGGLSIKDIRHISEFKGLFFSNPLLSLSLVISLFSMAGIPPLIGFFSKQFVLYSALQNGYYFISILAIIVSVISASYYLKIVKILLDTENTGAGAEELIPPFEYDQSYAASGQKYAPIKKSMLFFNAASSPSLAEARGNKNINSKKIADINGNTSTLTSSWSIELSNIHSYIISTLTLIILLFFIKPSIILNSTKLLTLSLFNI